STRQGQSVGNVCVRDLTDPARTLQISLHTNATVAGDPNAASRPTATPSHPTGVVPNGDSFAPSISSDGRFVSFLTSASDVVPPRMGGENNTELSYTTLVVCDRDPNANGKFDELRSGTQVPDYVCFPVESGNSADGGL